MRVLLPEGRTLGILAVGLVVVSLGLGALIRPEELPTRPTPHLPIVGLYLLAGGLLAALLRQDERSSSGVVVPATWRQLFAGAGVVLVASPVLGVAGAPLSVPVFLSYYVAAVGTGVVSLGAVALALRTE
jgi:hypothetical protein